MKKFFIGFVFSLFFVFTSASALNRGSLGEVFEYMSGKGWELPGWKIRYEGIDGVVIKNESIESQDIMDGAISSSDIQDGSIAGVDIQEVGIQGVDIGVQAIDGLNIDMSQVQLTGDNIKANTINAANIKDSSIGSDDVDSNSIQNRITGQCSQGIKSIAKNGTPTCVTSPTKPSYLGSSRCGSSRVGYYKLSSNGMLYKCQKTANKKTISRSSKHDGATAKKYAKRCDSRTWARFGVSCPNGRRLVGSYHCKRTYTVGFRKGSVSRSCQRPATYGFVQK